VFRHGFAQDPVEWTLDADRRAESPAHVARCDKGYGSRMLECSQCGAIRIAGEACSHCGFLPQRPPRDVFVDRHGELGLVTGGRAQPHAYDPAERAEWHAMLAWIADERGYKQGWVAHKYKEKFGGWPSWGSTPQPILPTTEVLAWVRSRMIAYAKRQSAT
jgi:DNA repair protein RadD